jgi:hypothetical protein
LAKYITVEVTRSDNPTVKPIYVLTKFLFIFIASLKFLFAYHIFILAIEN